ncbi:MAG TPA: hypothetical protein VIX91_20560, partial [Candidatus Acidoferrum sp.]
KISIYDHNGQLLTGSDCVHMPLGISDHKNVLLKTLSPGSQFAEYAIINRLCNIRSGTYRIQVAKTIPQYLGNGEIESNKVEFTVRQ